MTGKQYKSHLFSKTRKWQKYGDIILKCLLHGAMFSRPKYFKFLWSINFKSLQTHFNEPPTLPLYPTHKGFPQMMHQFCSKTTTMAMNDDSNDYNSSSLPTKKWHAVWSTTPHTCPKTQDSTVLPVVNNNTQTVVQERLLLSERSAATAAVVGERFLSERDQPPLLTAAVVDAALLSTKRKLLLLLSCQERVRLGLYSNPAIEQQPCSRCHSFCFSCFFSYSIAYGLLEQNHVWPQ